MTAKPDTYCASCPLLLGKSDRCGHKVLYGMKACWRRDGVPNRPCGAGGKSPFAYEPGEPKLEWWK